MSLVAIKEFLTKLQNLHKNYDIKGFTIPSYEFDKYNNEISLLHSCIFHHDYENEKLQQVFQKIFQKEYLELLHPTLNIPTRAVFTIDNTLCQYKNYNRFIFFIDKKNQNPWLLVQENLFAYIIITKNELLGLKALNEPLSVHYKWILWLCFERLPQLAQIINPKELLFREKKIALSFENPRPYHYFSDDLFWFHKLDLKQSSILNTPMFFKSSLMTNFINEENRLKIRPSLFRGNKNIDLQQTVFNEALSDFNTLIPQEDKFTCGGGD